MLAILAASIPSFSSPVSNTNLLTTINAAVPIDEHRLNNAINEISGQFDVKLNDLHIILTNDVDERETRLLLQKITDIIASSVGGNIPPNVVSISTGQQNQSLNLAAYTIQPLNLAASTTNIPAVLFTNDYDKSVEIEQRKLVNPDIDTTVVNSI